MVAAAGVPATAATPPSISAITPNVGAIAGGNTVTITGHNFVPPAGYTDALSGAQYAQLEYLTFTGTQYINSGVKNNGVIDAEVDFKFASSSGSGTLFGAVQTYPLQLANAFVYIQADFYYVYNPTTNLWQTNTTNLSSSGSKDINRHTFSKKGNTAQLDATSITSNVGTMALVGTYDFYVGAMNLIGSPMYYLKGNIYSLKMWCNSVLVRNYVAVFNIATGEKGLFDIANNKFYGSSAGAFDNAYAVTFDGIAATNVVVSNDIINDTITCTVPAHAVGTVDVAVSLDSERDTLKQSYTHLPDTITVTARDTFKVYGNADPAIPYTLTDKGGHDITGATVDTFGRAAGDNVGEYRLTFNTADWAFADHVFKFDTAGVRFSITKAKRAFKDSTVSVTYSAGLTLGSIPLTSHYQWITASTPLTAADSGNMFPAKYIDPAGNYYDTTGTIQVNISKAAGSFTHADLYVTYTPGLKLSDVALSNTDYAWENGGQFLNVADSGHLYSAIYTDPSGNYAVDTGLVKVHIYKASYAGTDIAPHPALTAVYTSTNTLSDVVGLQPGYTWVNSNTKLTVAQTIYPAKYNADSNYNDFSLNITVNVIPGIGSATVSLNDWTYGTPDTLVVTSATNDIAGVTYMYDSIIGSTYHSATQPKNAGSYKVIATFAAGANYQQVEATDTFEITKKTLTVTADNKTKTQGAANPTLTLTYSGWEYGDNENSFTTQPTIWTLADKESHVNLYPIFVDSAVSSNYDFTYVPGTLTVTVKHSIAVVWSDTTFVYDSLPHKPTATVTINGVVIPLTVDTAQTEVGTYTAYASFTIPNDTTTLSGDTVQFSITPDTTALDTLLVFNDYAVVKLGYNAIFLHLRKLRENIGFRPLECEWYHNGKLIGTGFVHSAGPTRQHKIEPGNYTFKLIGDSAVYYSTEQYLEVKFKSPLTIYPNPVSNEQLHIGNVRMLTLENASNSPTVEIYDIKGVLVLELPLLPFTSDNTATIDVSRLRAGVYIVKVGENISKVVVQ
ncbi:hypothetical protein AGMMS4956_17040 [Bacteroidia bacterium]|nr:hypothetical protein AGMMS4956_17040 [Bacteroidia bacterium]